jgi:hypothetical protein
MTDELVRAPMDTCHTEQLVAVHQIDPRTGIKCDTRLIPRSVWITRYHGIDYGLDAHGAILVVGNIVNTDPQDLLNLTTCPGIDDTILPSLSDLGNCYLSLHMPLMTPEVPACGHATVALEGKGE